jgi:hypothetical protein
MRNKEIGWSKESSLLHKLMKELSRLGTFVSSALQGKIDLTLTEGTYSEELVFSNYEEVFQENVTASFTLASSGNINGVGKILRLNTPTSVSFSADFEAHPDSEDFDNTKLNLVYLMYYKNWDGVGGDKVIYMNNLFDAV